MAIEKLLGALLKEDSCARRFTFKISKVLAVTVFALALCVSGARAQGTADVVGTVTDTSGGVIPDATVTLTNTGTNISQTAKTTGSGDYVFALVQVGTYTVKVEAKGFKTFVAPSLSLSSGDRARVDAPMQVGEQSTTVEVQASTAPALQTDTSTIGSLVTSQAVEDVPLNGRNVTKLVQLAAGVSEGAPGSIVGGTRPDDRRQTNAFSVNGQSDFLNNQMIDGLDNNERIVGGNVARPSVDGIQEISVSTNKYDASVGRTGGGVVNIITKAGSNNFHGSAYEFFRNKVLNTNPGYSFASDSKGGVTTIPPNPPYRQNQYGVSIGGPIKKDKTFFFGDFEQFRQANGLPVGNALVPTLCERGSALAALQGYTGSAITCPDGTSPTKPGDFSDSPAISLPGGSSSACTTGTGGNYGTSSCPFVVVPSASITPLGQAYFSSYPLPNCPVLTSTCNSYAASPTRSQNSTTMDFRIDQHFSDKDSMYGHYTINNVVTETPPSFPNVTILPTTGLPAAAGTAGAVTFNPVSSGAGNGFPGPEKERQQSLGVSYVHIFNPNLLLNLKVGYVRNKLFEAPPNYNSFISNKLGFACNTIPNSLSPLGQCINAPNEIYSTALATVSPVGAASIGDTAATPLFETDNTFIYSAGLTWNKGAHSVRFGLALNRRQASVGESPLGVGPEATFPFSGAYTGVGLGDLLEGLSIGGSMRSYPLWQGSLGTWEPSGYVQDDWRVKHWLTLNLGMRYDIFTPMTEHRNRITNFDVTQGLLVGPGLPGNQQSGSTAGILTDFKNIAPRFGFAATLKHDLVIRGGFGLSFFPVNYASQYNLKNAPGTYFVNCTIQNQSGTNTTCPAPFGNSTVANYGQAPSNSSSPVGKSGGISLAAGMPVAYSNVGLVIPPTSAQCFLSTTLPYSQTCPAATDPYQGYTISNAIPFNFPSEYLEQANLQIQKAFGDNVITIGEVTGLGRHTPKGINIQSLSNAGQNGVLPLTAQFPWLGKTATILQSGTYGTDSYNALQATFVRRFSKGLTAQVNYTWAHGETFTGGSCTPTQTPTAMNNCFYDNPASPASPIAVAYWNKGGFNNGNSGNDVADRFAWTANYQLPFGKSMTGVEGAIIKGWAANVAGSWQTGLPFTVATSVNRTGLAAAGNPDQICSGRLAHPTLLKWFDASCFTEQFGTNVFGNEHGSQLIGPPQRRLDFSLFKEFPIKENLRMQFRTEVFNLFNTPNFNTPSNVTISKFSGGAGSTGTNVNSNLNAVPVGAITGLNTNSGSRVIQFGLKLLF